MRTAFLCGGLEPGRDGIGDYARLMAGEFLRQGHPSVVLALNDPNISALVFESQEVEVNSLPVLRLPSTMPWSNRIHHVRDWLDIFSPDWMSLQFVPFAFHRKGLCSGLGKQLAALTNDASWHVMFHELWLGLEKGASLKHRFWGALQRQVVLDFMRRLRPQIVHTQTKPYRSTLVREGIEASVLPLFSNIPRIKSDGWNDLLEPLVTAATRKHQERSGLYLAGVFGAVPPEWSAEDVVDTVLPLVRRFQKRLVLVFSGKNHLTPKAFDKLRSALRNRADVIMTGERKKSEISRILQSLDLGLATTPHQVIEKSGSVAAMLEHGLPVLVTRDDWHLRGAPIQPPQESFRLLSPKQFARLKTLPPCDSGQTAGRCVRHVAEVMIAAIKSSKGFPSEIVRAEVNASFAG